MKGTKAESVFYTSEVLESKRMLLNSGILRPISSGNEVLNDSETFVDKRGVPYESTYSAFPVRENGKLVGQIILFKLQQPRSNQK